MVVLQRDHLTRWHLREMGFGAKCVGVVGLFVCLVLVGGGGGGWGEVLLDDVIHDIALL